MKKFEYTSISWSPTLPDVLTTLGAVGWEAYAVISEVVEHGGIRYPAHTFFLKREIIDTKQVIL